ncbi:DUF4405 domain-containing protein [Pelotomaculum isophthalicicum JI]|uniref:DUF4405 domain-containing protein n=1 Tax=Pelotomaculum isophthalicicum JI TaxID=947010 RepID=A0A9X4JWL2_9FIRM|nr:DUF4405 domain-containing protein [Pelotomaculum isophthalicicum]MDF9409597.1 DUF4405 domain-containing protein [Pelotomaculum isophthalicicum JI]
MRARKYTSIILTLAFIILSVTGIQMHMMHVTSEPHGPRGPHGPFGTEGVGNSPVINESGKSNISTGTLPTKSEDGFYPKRLHELAGYTFIIAALVHLKLNYKTLISHIGIKKSKVRL